VLRFCDDSGSRPAARRLRPQKKGKNMKMRGSNSKHNQYTRHETVWTSHGVCHEVLLCMRTKMQEFCYHFATQLECSNEVV